jgi:hypothetical protein
MVLGSELAPLCHNLGHMSDAAVTNSNPVVEPAVYRGRANAPDAPPKRKNHGNIKRHILFFILFGWQWTIG